MNRRLPLCCFTLIGAISDMYLNLTYYKPNKFTMCVLVLQINTHTQWQRVPEKPKKQGRYNLCIFADLT